MRPTDSDEGFALVESIGVLFVSALVVVALTLTASLFVRASTGVARQANTSEVLLSGLSAFRREMSGALALAAGSDAKDPILFQGSPSAVGFLEAGEVVWIEATAGKRGGFLTRAARPAPPDIRDLGSPEAGTAVPLIAGPWTFRLSYSVFDAAGSAWVGEWIGRRTLPDLIRLDVFRADGRGQPVASLVTAPHARRDRHCAFDDPKSCLTFPVAASSP